MVEVGLDGNGFDLDATRTGPMAIRSASFDSRNPILFTGFNVEVITRNATASRSGLRPAIEVVRPTAFRGFHETNPGVPAMGCAGTALDVFERSWHEKGRASLKARVFYRLGQEIFGHRIPKLSQSN